MSSANFKTYTLLLSSPLIPEHVRPQLFEMLIYFVPCSSDLRVTNTRLDRPPPAALDSSQLTASAAVDRTPSVAGDSFHCSTGVDKGFNPTRSSLQFGEID